MSNFLAQAFVFLLAAVVCVLISKKLGMGSVLGYLLAGVIIGPFVFGFIGQGGEGLMHVTEFGVVMMLFLVGLSIDPKEFWESRKDILGLGLAQSLSTILLVTIACFFIVGLPFGTALTIGFVVTMSSTAIILQTLSERGLNKSTTGKSSFAVLLFQDVLVIPILAIIPLLAFGNSGNEVAVSGNGNWLEGAPVFMKTLAILGAISLIFFVGNYIVNPLFKSVGRLKVKEIYTACALSLVIGVSLLMEQVGLSPALGAFIAGVVLANNPYKQQLESDIEPFKALLLGMFFIAVGSTINFSVIAEQPLIILGLLLGTIVIKGIVLLGIGKWKKFSKDESFLFAILLAQIGEFAFVILALGKSTNLISVQWYDYLIATTALSMVITPILLLLNEKWISPFLGFKPIKKTSGNNYDELSDIQAAKKVMIAGFGDFGMTVGRLLHANNISTLIMDNDPENVEYQKKLGFNVIYGDATSLSMLKSIEVEKADCVIAALDPPDVNHHFVELINKNFPHLKVLVRAKDRKDAYDYIRKGQEDVFREKFYSAVGVASKVMANLGFTSDEIEKQREMFVWTDRRSLQKLARNSESFEDYIHLSKFELAEQAITLKENLNRIREKKKQKENEA